ncbi:hypothetical protein [Yersinia aleksiciae]|uniref:hypothetical protein n=1 Tax=Yersinia aleksiciae TaxID=263819 RepID=UPI0011A08366|nr:hypothetical protein [Yersinia aleksiciae]
MRGVQNNERLIFKADLSAQRGFYRHFDELVEDLIEVSFSFDVFCQFASDLPQHCLLRQYRVPESF